jgi:TRAP-type C4-dicarboxylate transport system permease small subunit
MVISTATVVLTLLGVVICRHVLHYNFLGYAEVLVIAAMWMYFIGSSYGSWEESHINADIVSQFVSERTKTKLGIVSKIIQLLLGIPMIYLAYEMLLFNLQTNPVTVDLQVPMAFPQSAILISFVLMTFYCFIYVLRDIQKLKEM